MTNARDFGPFVPTLAYPRVAAMQGRDAHAHGAAGLANPLPRDLLFTPWEALYHAPFTGITADGTVQPGLFALGPDGASGGASDGTSNAASNGVPTQAMVAASMCKAGVCARSRRLNRRGSKPSPMCRHSPKVASPISTS